MVDVTDAPAELPPVTVTPEAPAQMPQAAQIKAWLDSNPDKAGSQDFVTMKQAYDSLLATPAPAPTGPTPVSPGPRPPGPPAPPPTNAQLPGPRLGKDPRLMEPLAPRIDYNAPIEQVRANLGAVQNEPSRQAGWNRWAGFEEQKQHDQGGVLRGANDWIRAIAAGVPGGAWGDEINAGVGAVLPNALGGRPYEEGLALERARNNRFAYEHPYGNVAANLGGAVASAPFTTVRGAGVGLNTGIDMLIAAIQGAGGAEGGLDRPKAAVTDAAITAPLSLLMNSVLHNVGKYGVTSENVVRAADQLGISHLLPAFVKAANPEIQAMGRQTAQGSLGSPLNRGWQASVDATEQAGKNIATREAGTTDVMTTPHEVGTRLGPQLEATAEAAQAEKATLARQNEELLPPGVRYDVPQMRQATEDVVTRRAERGAVNPEAGLGDQLAMTTRAPPDPMNGPFAHYGPGGSTWPGMADQATEIGQRIGLPDMVPREVDNAQLAYIMRGLRDDQRSIMRRDAGPAGEATFTRNLDRQGELSDLQRAISDAMGKKPEDIVNLAHRSASISGGGTNLDALNTITQALRPEDRVALGGGVLAKIVNEAGGSPQKIASALADIPEAARARLFPAGTRLAADVEAFSTVAGRVGEVNQFQHVGSAKTLNEKLAIAGKYGGLGGGAAGSLYLADKAGYGEPAAGLGTALLGARYGFNRFAKPYLLQHGVSDAIQTGMNAARGVPRGVGSLYQPPPSEPQ